MTLVVAIGSTMTFGLLGGVGAGTLSTVAAGVLGGATLGSGLGAVKSAIAGEDVGKGALMGAATGAVGGGLAPGVGAAGAAAGGAGSAANIAAQTVAGGATGALANTAGAAVGGKDIGNAALVGGITGGALSGLNAAGGAPATSGPVDTPANGVSVGMDQPGALDVLGSKITGMSGTQAAQNVGILGAGAMAEHALNQKPEEAVNVTPGLAPGITAAMRPKDVYNQGPMGGMGSIGMARGGQVPVRDGAYIIPADVVSALGNGSSKAGAEFLRRLMEEVKSQGVKRHGLGAVKRAAA